MAFQTGTATDIDDLIDTDLKAFAVAQGWTNNDDSWPNFLALSRGNCFINLRRIGENGDPTGTQTVPSVVGADVLTNGLYAFLSTGYSSAGATADDRLVAQPNALITATAQLGGNAIQVNDLFGTFPSYAFFTGGPSDPHYIYAVIETRAGYFQHLWFGNVDQLLATYTTGSAFAAGSFYQIAVTNALLRDEARWTTLSHRQPFDDASSTTSSSNVQLYVGNAEVAGDRIRRTYFPAYRRWGANLFGGIDGSFASQANSGKWATNLFELGPNPTNGQTPLIPILAAPQLSTVATAFFPLGILPNVRLCSMKGRFPGEEITFGTETWVVYPMRRQRTDDGVVPAEELSSDPPFQATSAQAGWAYKKVT